MATITPEMREFIEHNLGWVATVSPQGQVDLGPKMSTFVIDDNHIGYHERTAGQTHERPAQRFAAGHRLRESGGTQGVPFPWHRHPAR